MKQLEQDMAAMMGDAQKESGTSDNKDFQDTVEQGADAFAKQLEDSGVPPGDFLKQLLAEVMAEEGGGGSGGGGGKDTTPSASAKGNANTAATAEGTPESFNDAIQRTMNRMQESGDKATAAANDSDDVPDEMLLQLLKALESSSGGNDDDIQKMFMGFMEKMSSKDILYEPMKELEGKFEPWIAEKQAKKELSEEDIKRYQMQTRIVKEVVAKFEEDGYSDSDSKCREWVWEKMQEVCSLLCPCHARPLSYRKLTPADAKRRKSPRRTHPQSSYGHERRTGGGLAPGMRPAIMIWLSNIYSIIPRLNVCTCHGDSGSNTILHFGITVHIPISRSIPLFTNAHGVISIYINRHRINPTLTQTPFNAIPVQ